MLDFTIVARQGSIYNTDGKKVTMLKVISMSNAQSYKRVEEYSVHENTDE